MASNDRGRKRLEHEKGLARIVAARIDPVVENMGYRLVQVRMIGQNATTVQIMAERADLTMTIDDCEKLSRAISPVLDVEDIMPGSYNLEVSSPGLDRPLVRLEDFKRWRGYQSKIEMMVDREGRRRFRGTLLGVEGNCVELRLEGEGGKTVHLPFNEIDMARLLITDALIRDCLARPVQ